MSNFFSNLQKVLPHHGMSRLVGHLGKSHHPFIRKAFIRSFARAYDIDLHEAQADDLDEYDSFNAFFTRALKSGSRPIEDGVVSPADGRISQVGAIQHGTLLQAKGHRYDIRSLAGKLSGGFDNGQFVTIYLAPSDYHRVHLPLAGVLQETLAVPGALFSVNGITEAGIEGLFCRNERLVCRFDTEIGPMLVVLVGAMIVASIETVWPGTPSPYRSEIHQEYQLPLATGDEIGRFLLGSTVIVCFQHQAVSLKRGLSAGDRLRMGEQIATIS